MYAFLPVEILQRLASTGGGGARYRPEVISAYLTKSNFGISISPAPEDIGETLHRFSSFAWNIPDNDLCTRGNSHIFCFKFPEYKTKRNWEPESRMNISDTVLKALGDNSGENENLAKEVVFYVYSVLCSNEYMNKFEGALYQTSGEWPRIPIPADRKQFIGMANLGRQLAEIEKNDFKIGVDSDMKRYLKLFEREIGVRKFSIDERNATLHITDLEDNTFIIPVDRDVLSYRISGYSVLTEWLKWHTWPYLRRKFRFEDGQYLLCLISKIRRQFEIIEKIDCTIEKILANPSNLQ